MDEIRIRSTSFIESLEYLIVKYLYYDLGSGTQIHVDFHKADFYILKKGLVMDRNSDNYFTA
jgi:hypothetical protein